MSAQAPPRVATTPFEVLVVVAICFGLPIYWSLLAVGRGFSSAAFTDAGLVALLQIEFVTAAIALVFLAARNYAVHTLMPEPTWRGLLTGAALYGACWCATFVLTNALVAAGAAGPESQPIARMVDEARVSMLVAVPVSVVNGVFEEVFLLGVVMRGLRSYGGALALGVMELVRLSYHLYQGPLGAVNVLAFGAILGLWYVRDRRLWPPIVAHVVADILGFALASP